MTLPLGCSGTGAGDEGLPSRVYPAFLPDAPQVVRGDAGVVLRSPTVRSITFAGDPLQGELAGFLEELRAPSYWTTTTGEYGVGPLSIGAPIVVDEEAPASVDSSQIEAWLAAKLDGTHSEFGRPQEQTIYLVVYPSWTTLIWESQPTCGGYHGGLLVAGKAVHYAAVADCADTTGQPADIMSTAPTISHELVETATDPNFASPSLSGYHGMDSDHLAWQFFSASSLQIPLDGIEIGDLAAGVEAAREAARVSDLEFAFDRTTGVNGEKLHLTITRIRPAVLGSSIAVLRSESNGSEAFWPFAVGQ